MGLAKRIIPTLLIRGDTLVKGRQFASWRSVGHPMTAVKTHQARGVDEIILLDIGATPERRGPNCRLIEKLAAECFSTPLTVGGGVRSVQDVRDLLNAGADKVAICTAAIEEPRLIKDCADKFGRQALVGVVDHKGRDAYTRGVKVNKFWTAMNFARTLVNAGVGELMLTSMEQEGTMLGYDYEVIQEVSKAVDVPVVAHGGCGDPSHMFAALYAGASAVAAGAMFQFSEWTPKMCAQALHSSGVEVRL